MTRLTELQREALTRAHGTNGGALIAAAIEELDIPKRSLTSLVKRALLEEVPTGDEELVSRRDGGSAFCLRITEAGRAAVEAATDGRDAIDAKAAGPASGPTKQNAVLKLLRRKNGASLSEIMEATGWQQHSVRGFLSGTVKKKLGMEVISERSETRGRVYRASGARA